MLKFCRLLSISILAAMMVLAGESRSRADDQPSTNPTDGFENYTDTFKVQHPYDLQESDRFSSENGIYTCWIFKTDKPFSKGSGTGPRTEMRWNTNWTKIEHMWEADVMYEPGTDHTCLMQVKSNDGFEAVYLNVQNNILYHDSDHKHQLLTDSAGKWFHVLAAYNPTTGRGRVWINGELKLDRVEKHPLDTVWYFKNGVYNTNNASKSHFKNIKFWIAKNNQ